MRWCDFARARHRDPMRPDPVTVRVWAASMEGTGSLIGQARAVIAHLCAMLEVDDVSPAMPLPRKSRNLRSRALHPQQGRRLAQAADRAGIAGLAVLVGQRHPIAK
ncbi:MAG: hypothetical protein KY462_09720 [Actinobacteria bacterium]|nr:hypothetical protein [Actinomycetota bacterium]